MVDSSDGFNLYQAQIQAQQQASQPNGLSTSSNSLSTSSGAASPNAQQQQRATDPWGLLGLARVLKMTDKDLNALTLGTDLTGLGLNLSSPEYVPSA